MTNVRQFLDDENSSEINDEPFEDDLNGNKELLDKDEYEEALKDMPVDDPLGIYLRQIGQIPLLTADEEISLAIKILEGIKAEKMLYNMNGDESGKQELIVIVNNAQNAREQLAEANTRLVVSIAKKYMNRGVAFPDLIQFGNVGLMRAVDKFDHKRGHRFSTYATWWIRQAVTRAIATNSRTIRVPVHMSDSINTYQRVKEQLTKRLEREPIIEEIADAMESSPTKVEKIIDALRIQPIALEKLSGEDSDGEFGEFLEDRKTPSPADAADAKFLEENIEELLSELTPRQSYILRLRFGIGYVEGVTHTLEEIANKFGLSRERIRQIEKEALKRLRDSSRSYPLIDYLES